MRSPCFVHSKLQGPSFTEWIREKHVKAQETRLDGMKPSADVNPIGLSYPDGTLSDAPSIRAPHYDVEDDDEEETAGSLTKQLAETAVGVREMSKQLGEYAARRSPD